MHAAEGREISPAIALPLFNRQVAGRGPADNPLDSS